MQKCQKKWTKVWVSGEIRGENEEFFRVQKFFQQKSKKPMEKNAKESKNKKSKFLPNKKCREKHICIFPLAYSINSIPPTSQIWILPWKQRWGCAAALPHPKTWPKTWPRSCLTRLLFRKVAPIHRTECGQPPQGKWGWFVRSVGVGFRGPPPCAGSFSEILGRTQRSATPKKCRRKMGEY